SSCSCCLLSQLDSVFSFLSSPLHRDLHSFPTRRSSDLSLLPFCRRWATLPSLKWCVPASAESPAARKCWACKPCLRSVEKAGQRSWSAFLYLYLWRPYVLCRQLLPESADDGAF